MLDRVTGGQTRTEDLAALEQAGDGLNDVLGRLFEQHRTRLRKMVSLRMDPRLRARVDASDVLQETYVEVSAPDRATTSGIRGCPFFVWLRFLTAQKIVALYRHHVGTQKRGRAPPGSPGSRRLPGRFLGRHGRSVDGHAGQPERSGHAGGGAPPDRRRARCDERPPTGKVLVMRHFEQLSNVETAHELGLEKSAASKRYLRALQRTPTRSRAGRNRRRLGVSSGRRLPPELDDLVEDFVARERAGEQPTISEYVRRHPELASGIREVFPLLPVLEAAGSETECTAPPRRLEGLDPRIRKLGGYRLLREIGRGGMGVVYEAEQEELGRRVALKVLPAQAMLDPRFVERFRLEAQAAARLQHPHIVPVIGLSEDRGVHFYTMQYIDGHGLDEVLEHSRALVRRTQREGADDSNAAARLFRRPADGHFEPCRRDPARCPGRRLGAAGPGDRASSGGAITRTWRASACRRHGPSPSPTRAG